MERIEPSSQNPYIRKPESIYIEKPVEIKTDQVGQSALKQLAVAAQESKKNFRFDNEVIHKQTRGKLKADGTYEVEVRMTRLDLVDEDKEERGITKNDLYELEQAIVNEKSNIENGEQMSTEDQEALERVENLMHRLNNLFNGRHALPKELPKPTPRDSERLDRTLSAGHLTGTYGKTQIVKETSASWPKDEEKEIQLQKLHDEAIEEIKEEARGNLTTTQTIANKMFELREAKKKETLTKEDVYNLYLDFDRKKEKFLTEEIIDQIRNTPSASERQKILNDYYHENHLPLGEKNKVDIEEIKDFLEKNLDLVFKDDTLRVKYSDIVEKDIIQFIEKKYTRKKS